MAKITVKHFLNTNLKPYFINGEKYFSIYALVTANRQNTKVKSKAFNEYYTEKDFIEISDPVNIDDFETLKNEEITIINIVGSLISELDTFDPTLFAAFYNYYQIIYVFDLEIQKTEVKDTTTGGEILTDLFNGEKNKLGVGIDKFLIEPFSLKENQSKGLSVFSWYSEIMQNNLKAFLVANNCKYDLDRSIEILNKIVFFESMTKIKEMIRHGKYEILLDKYRTFLSFPELKTVQYFKELSL